MKNKKNIVILLFVAVVSLVGLTVAYFSNSTDIINEFETAEYGTDVTETFTSPTGWQPGDETPKVLKVKNTGEVDEAVRIKVEEKWVNKNGQELPLMQDGNVAAQINYINSSDWTKVEVANESYYYYYYNYKLAPNEETSELLDKVTFNPLINASTTCTDSTGANGETIRSCKSNESGYDGATYTLKFTIETVQYNKYQEAWNTDFNIIKKKPLTLQQFIEQNTNDANAEYNSLTMKKMFIFTHGTGENTVTETRYIGNKPNNYVKFNCDANGSNCEEWRILGTFDVERTDPNDSTKTITETRIKLVRGSGLADKKEWDNRLCETCTDIAYGKNDWNGSVMQTFLTGAYYNQTGEAETNGLKPSARGMIDDTIFYLGGFPYINSDTTYNAEKLYEMERGTDVYNTRPTSWEGKVALMYPSDMYMTYAKTDGIGCYNQPMNSDVCGESNGKYSWVYNSNRLDGFPSFNPMWFLTPYSSGLSNTVYKSFNSSLGNSYANEKLGVRPVVYLKSNIKIANGTGGLMDPYVFTY